MKIMNITQNNPMGDQHRIIIEAKGHEIDIIANADGLIIEVRDQNGLLTDCGIDWPSHNDN